MTVITREDTATELINLGNNGQRTIIEARDVRWMDRPARYDWEEQGKVE